MPESLPLGQTTGYCVEFHHSRSEGISCGPVAGKPPQNASLVRLHAPFELMSVYWSAISEGKPPLVPSHKGYALNPNRVFLGGERVGIVTPNLVGHIWVMAGRLDFCVVGPEGLDSQFCLAKCPWEPANVNEFFIPRENFLPTGIINPTWNQPTGLAVNPDVTPLDLQQGIIP